MSHLRVPVIAVSSMPLLLCIVSKRVSAAAVQKASLTESAEKAPLTGSALDNEG